jgi:hypothetical protein
MNTMEEHKKEIQDLLEKYPGITNQWRIIFEYHYDAMQRELYQTLNTIPGEDRGTLGDHIDAFMEEDMNWPGDASGDNGRFKRSILA